MADVSGFLIDNMYRNYEHNPRQSDEAADFATPLQYL
jgi:hypothetical protein